MLGWVGLSCGWVGFVGVVGVGVGEWWVLCGVVWWWWWSGGEAKGGWVCVGCWEMCVSRLGPRVCQDGTVIRILLHHGVKAN